MARGVSNYLVGVILLLLCCSPIQVADGLVPYVPTFHCFHEAVTTVSLPLRTRRMDNAFCNNARRSFLKNIMIVSTVAATTVTATPANGLAAAAASLLQVTITIPKDTPDVNVEESSSSTAAVYITARPNTIDNVPRAILDGTRGKSPPVLVARIPISTSTGINDAFPLHYTFSPQDVTMEGMSTNNNDAAESNGSYWWQDSDLVVSARLDSDGIAATRDPSDLVGRSITNGAGGVVQVQLQGRGATGKFFTRKQ